ncbi:hypothetical protein [Brevibacillus panacihumi]|uniref:Uncharacterized protein n=1 Tax=Brevibacillus panacihumi TaxID=497735 RepID=A0A3M8CWP0_9BACL|nr:hypothetical protein [Brevibacillus panacihumi]RNB80048.1 hypothetical protein EDM58_09135 [Brevibacillus panacihumi]
MMEREDLLARQLQLQTEAAAVAEELNLTELLKAAGAPVKVGSAALGLMTWRDLDMTVVCSKLDIAAISGIASRLMAHPGVRHMNFINDTGSWNTDPVYPDGYFIGLKYQCKSGNEWELDIWFVDEPEKQPDLQHIRTMPGRLTPSAIVSILSIKSVWASRTEYGKQVKSFDIYSAVLDDHVRTPAEFERWLQSRNHIST